MKYLVLADNPILIGKMVVLSRRALRNQLNTKKMSLILIKQVNLRRITMEIRKLKSLSRNMIKINNKGRR